MPTAISGTIVSITNMASILTRRLDKIHCDTFFMPGPIPSPPPVNYLYFIPGQVVSVCSNKKFHPFNKIKNISVPSRSNFPKMRNKLLSSSIFSKFESG